MTTRDKIEQYRRFWRGEGSCLILIPTANMVQYDTAGYRARFDDPQLMWEVEMRRAEAVLDWRTYVRRLAGLVRNTGARLILRPVVFPESREECAAMHDMWNEWTS